MTKQVDVKQKRNNQELFGSMNIHQMNLQANFDRWLLCATNFPQIGL